MTTTATDTTLCQVKLTGEEWNGIEIMEPEDEMRILKLIIDGFHDVNHVFNLHMSLDSLELYESNNFMNISKNVLSV